MKPPKLHLAEALSHEAADKRIDILRRIGEVGSISEAARVAGVSYKAAWQALDTLSNLAGVALVERAVGGSGGGGAMLTEAGQQLLQAADQLAQARAQVLARLGQAHAGVQGLSALGLRTSMRNQLPCEVTALQRQGQAVRVALALGDGTTLYSRITQESAQLLGLRSGLAALALCKATAVQVSAGAEAQSGRNLLHGRVTRATRAAAGGEVSLALASGLQLVGFCGPDSGLRLKAEAAALLDESAVVVALPG